MAGADCGEVVDKDLDGYFVCGVRKGHFSFPNKALRGMIVERLWTRNSMVILLVVYVRSVFRSPIWHGGNDCGGVVYRKPDGYFGCGVCKGHFTFPNKT